MTINYDTFFSTQVGATTGTWLPEIANDMNNKATMNIQAGKWHRKLDLVHIEFFASMTDKGDLITGPGGFLRIINLPFNVAPEENHFSALSICTANNYEEIFDTQPFVRVLGALGEATPNSFNISYWGSTDGFASLISDNVDNNFEIGGSATYFANPAN